tara:strand:- start:181 stop:393 length:213 start_codon:yes stop_codon:yes gene_type:complete
LENRNQSIGKKISRDFRIQPLEERSSQIQNEEMENAGTGTSFRVTWQGNLDGNFLDFEVYYDSAFYKISA